MKKFVALIMMAAIMLGMLSGCGSSSAPAADAPAAETPAAETPAVEPAAEASGDQVSLRICWWGGQARHDMTQQAIDLYMEQNPNVTIVSEFTDWSGYWDKLATQSAGGGMPDIIQMDYSYIEQYASSNQLAALDDFMTSGVIDTSKISDSVIASGKVDGKCYGLALGSTAPMMAYDKETLDAAGVEMPLHPTIEEFYDICQKVYEATGVHAYYEGGTNVIEYEARNNGRVIYDELLAGETDSSLAHFTWLEKFSQAEFSVRADILAEKDTLVVDSMPIIDLTTWNAYTVSNGYPTLQQNCGRDLGVCMLPCESDATQEPVYMKPTMFFSVTETSQQKEEAAKFVDWFVNSEEANVILQGERGVPANSDVAAMLSENATELQQLIYDYVAEVNKIATPVSPPQPAGFSEVESVLVSLVEDIRYGDKTAEEATAEFVPKAQTILQSGASK